MALEWGVLKINVSLRLNKIGPEIVNHMMSRYYLGIILIPFKIPCKLDMAHICILLGVHP